MDATYSGANIFTVAGDRTSEFVPDRRLKADCGGDGIKYMTVLSSSYSTNTVVTTKESELTSNLTDVLYGIVEPGELGSLPDHDHLGGEGSGGFLQIETTFSGLTDTPDGYDAGKYLMSTVSGTEWSDSNFNTIESAKGKQSIKVEYATPSGIYINPGVVHIDDGTTEGYYNVPARLTKQLTGLSSSTFHYVYAVASGTVNNEITTSDIEYTTTVPSDLDYGRMGYYHPTNTDWRCIFAFRTSGTNVYRFTSENSLVSFIRISNFASTAASWTDVTLTIPTWGDNPRGYCEFYASYVNEGRSLYYRPKGTTPSYARIGRIDPSSKKSVVNAYAIADTDAKIQISFESGSSTNTAQIWTMGYILPDEIYTGA